ncbi:MAG TPA: hypothetical protein VJ672_12530 [Gemmatimonadaceae bacterium]|nr:hypothetical protein [Gemmatimonadaceae bacterium]
MTSRRAVLASLFVLVAAFAGPVAAQSVPVRFEVSAVTDDSLVTIALSSSRDAKWIRPGVDGIIVDPQRRDALVASFRVLAVTPAEASGVVTGQTTRVTTGNIAILNRPSPAWYARAAFWAGLVLGAIGGAVVGAQ